MTRLIVPSEDTVILGNRRPARIKTVGSDVLWTDLPASELINVDTIPLLRTDDYRRAPASAGQAAILLVEDNPADLFLIRQALVLNEVESQIFVASDGDEALRLIHDIDSGELPCPDLIVLDVNLPKVSGFRVLERLRASPKCHPRPVAILTSSDSPTDREEAARLGASRYIRKPTQLDQFMQIGRDLKELLLGPAGAA